MHKNILIDKNICRELHNGVLGFLKELKDTIIIVGYEHIKVVKNNLKTSESELNLIEPPIEILSNSHNS